MRLLLAEDDDKLRKELGKFFSMHGYETEEITDYEHMEEEILKARGQLLLLDMNLPFLDGKYLCSQLRKKTSLPVIIMTSQNTEMDELLSMNCGADDFIPKPFNPQILLASCGGCIKAGLWEAPGGRGSGLRFFSFKCVKRCGAKSGKRD